MNTIGWSAVPSAISAQPCSMIRKSVLEPPAITAPGAMSSWHSGNPPPLLIAAPSGAVMRAAPPAISKMTSLPSTKPRRIQGRRLADIDRVDRLVAECRTGGLAGVRDHALESARDHCRDGRLIDRVLTPAVVVVAFVVFIIVVTADRDRHFHDDRTG
ncbi:MAG: hypothetical protein OXG82_21580 [Gammaproteobacteria bacterium]|nr:hypothetical protein [Gammaproteobacteria bacterium]